MPCRYWCRATFRCIITAKDCTRGGYTAIDYVIDQPCKVKNKLTTDGMVSLVKQRNRALAILNMAKRDGKSDEQALNSTFRVQVMGPGGAQVKEQKVADLLNATRQLDELQALCKGCPVGQGRAYGCYKSIGYPITAKAEEWLAGITRHVANCKGVEVLPLRFIVEQEVDGGPFTRMRADPRGMFFELKAPLEAKMSNGLFKKVTIDTDQVFNILMGMGRMKRPHMEMLLYFSLAVHQANAEPEPKPFRLAYPMEGGRREKFWVTYDLPDGPEDDASTRALKEYFRSLFIAFVHERDVLISL